MGSGRVTHHRDDFVTAGLAFVREHGVSTLTARSLAEYMGVNHTVMYRHFTNMDDLMNAILSAFYAETEVPEPVGDTARQRLESFIANIRRTFSSSPELLALMASGTGDLPAGLATSRVALGLLEDLGLSGEDLVVCYQMIESYLIGVTLYDHLGAPDHLEVRRARYRMTDHPALDTAAPGVDDVGRINDAAFQTGIAALLDACEARIAASHRR
jgi:AcrR family transcriptional regulator